LIRRRMHLGMHVQESPQEGRAYTDAQPAWRLGYVWGVPKGIYAVVCSGPCRGDDKNFP